MYENFTAKLESAINCASPVQRRLAYTAAISLLERVFPDLMSTRNYPQSKILVQADSNFHLERSYADLEANEWLVDSKDALEGHLGKDPHDKAVKEVVGALETLIRYVKHNPFSAINDLKEITSAISEAPLAQQREAYLNLQELIDTVAPEEGPTVYVLDGISRLKPSKKRGERKQVLSLKYQVHRSSENDAYCYMKNLIELVLQKIQEKDPSLVT